MALRFTDSFDHYATGDRLEKWTTDGAGGGLAINAATGRNATSSARFTNWNRGQRITIDAQATWIVGFAYNPTAIPALDHFLLRFLDTAVSHVEIIQRSDGTIRARRGDGTVLGTSVATKTAATYQYLEVKVTISDAAGVVEIRLDGVAILTLVAQDTRNGGNATANIIALLEDAGSEAATVDLDDLYICDNTGVQNNDFLSDVRIEALLPNAAGNYAEWSLTGAASNREAVDDNPPDDDTSYVSSSTVGNKDSYNFSNLATAVGTVRGVNWLANARKDAAGARSLRRLLRTAGSDFFGSNIALGATYLYVNQIAELNPNTGVAWTIAEINALEAGQDLAA